jgi:raffinose/stachyose/melibiose transport system permease protein
VATNLPFTAFVYMSFIRTIPKELEEAAAIDGAGILTTAGRVVAPLLAPVTLTLLVLLSVIVWNDFVDPLLLLGAGEGTSTVTTGIYQSVGNYTLDWGAVFGYSVLGALPTVVLFLAMQRYIVGGLTAGALK